MKQDIRLSDEKDVHHTILENLLKSFNVDFKIIYIRSDSIGSYVNLTTREIYWDLNYWEYLYRHIYVSNEFGNREDIQEKMALGGLFLSNVANLLSTIQSKNIYLSAILEKESIEQGFNCMTESNMGNQEVPVLVCKVFLFLHEIAHILFSKDSAAKETAFDYVITALCKDPDDYISDSKDYFAKGVLDFRSVVNELSDGSNNVLLEELAADHFAMANCCRFFQTHLSINKQHLAFVIKNAIMNLFHFNITLNNIKNEWDFYLPILLLGITRREDIISIVKNRPHLKINYMRDHISLSFLIIGMLNAFNITDELVVDIILGSDSTYEYSLFFNALLDKTFFDEEFVAARFIYANELASSHTM